MLSTIIGLIGMLLVTILVLIVIGAVAIFLGIGGWILEHLTMLVVGVVAIVVMFEAIKELKK